MMNFQSEEEIYYDIESKISDIQAFLKTRYSAYNEMQVKGLIVKLRDKCDEIETDYQELDNLRNKQDL